MARYALAVSVGDSARGEAGSDSWSTNPRELVVVSCAHVCCLSEQTEDS
jgi:hypothetical protein